MFGKVRYGVLTETVASSSHLKLLKEKSLEPYCRLDA